MVYELYRALKVTIIGTGGVLCGLDAIEMIMARATAVGLATAAHRHGPPGVLSELDGWMTSHAISSLDEIRGAAHS